MIVAPSVCRLVAQRTLIAFLFWVQKSPNLTVVNAVGMNRVVHGSAALSAVKAGTVPGIELLLLLVR